MKSERARGGAVDLYECPRITRSGRRTQNCFCEPACAVCRYGKHCALHGPEYGEPPGSRPWHHEYVPGEGRPDYTWREGSYAWSDHPRQPWPETLERPQ